MACPSNFFRPFRSPHPAAVLQAGMFRDLLFPTRWHARVGQPDCSPILPHIGPIDPFPPLGLATFSGLPQVGIGKTLRFRPIKGVLLDQQALPLVSLACPGPFQDNRGITGVLPCPPVNAASPGGRKARWSRSRK